MPAKRQEKPTNSTSADVDHAIETLRRGIQRGEYVPGQRLVEIDLIEQLGVSRGRVREALRRLAAEGLVEIEKNRGASVRKISRKEVNDIFEVLTDVSVITVRRAMESMDDPANRRIIENSLKAARRFHERADRVRQVTDYMEENARFWNSLGDVVDNPFLHEIRLRLQTLLFRLQLQGLTVHGDRDQWILQHEDVLVAMLEGDAKRAERLCEKSSIAVKEAILALPDSAFA